MTRRVRYFAYGSNMHPHRLRERTPSCRAIGVATLEGFELRFHKRSDNPTDLSGKCNLIESHFERTVRGVVYELDARDKPLLDAAEGNGYRNEAVSVTLSEGVVEAFCYFARDTHVVHSLRPYHWYKELVVAGALHHGLPRDYVDLLRIVEAIDDHDARRSRHHFCLARRTVPVE